METPIAFDALALGRLPERHARYRPRHTAVIAPSGDRDVRLSWRELDAYVNSWANALASQGATRGGHKERLHRLLPDRFYELYGLTEGFVTILDRDDSRRKAGSVGVPPPFYEMRIVGDDGRDLPPNATGDIVGRGPRSRCRAITAATILPAAALRDGWLYTGDLGYVDDDGYLYLVDRKKDMIDSGGVKVYPKDIEEIVAQHPDVREAAVFGIPHDTWGETPVAAVVLNAGATVGADSLRDWINARCGEVSARRTGDRLYGFSTQCGRQDAEARNARAILESAKSRDLVGLKLALWPGRTCTFARCILSCDL